MSVYRGNKLIAAGGRDVNPETILSGNNICNVVSPNGQCVTINVVDCPTVCKLTATAQLNGPNFTSDENYNWMNKPMVAPDPSVSGTPMVCRNGHDYFEHTVCTPGATYQCICCLTEAAYQALVSAGTVNANTYYFTPGQSCVCPSAFNSICAGTGITLSCTAQNMTISNRDATYIQGGEGPIGTYLGHPIYRFTFDWTGSIGAQTGWYWGGMNIPPSQVIKMEGVLIRSDNVVFPLNYYDAPNNYNFTTILNANGYGATTTSNQAIDLRYARLQIYYWV